MPLPDSLRGEQAVSCTVACDCLPHCSLYPCKLQAKSKLFSSEQSLPQQRNWIRLGTRCHGKTHFQMSVSTETSEGYIIFRSVTW